MTIADYTITIIHGHADPELHSFIELIALAPDRPDRVWIGLRSDYTDEGLIEQFVRQFDI